jgi:predicted ATP-dependent endonuclease of OLD family
MKKAYITRTILKDYLTIKEVDVTFNEGINIIIGKNGTGKTNFINYLADSLKSVPSRSSSFSEINFSYFGESFSKSTIKTSKVITGDEITIEDNLNVEVRDVDGNVVENKNFIELIFATVIGYHLPSPYFIANETVTGVIKKNENNVSIFPNIKRNRLADVIGLNYITEILMSEKSSEYGIDYFLDRIRINLFKYSNIKGIRIGVNTKIETVALNEAHFTNLYLEYFVNGEWLLFNQLSDGTKRLFYIISEIEYSKSSIILLEEPELGLHPHQLYDLMRFIKEMSEDYQFIITTHSPMVLDTLDSNELGNIIISSIENGSTKLEHLTSEQIDKAKLYMKEELDLSDYWIHSDLEY